MTRYDLRLNPPGLDGAIESGFEDASLRISLGMNTLTIVFTTSRSIFATNQLYSLNLPHIEKD